MREKLQTLPLTELKELAKAQGIRGISGMKKSDLIDLLCEKDKEAEDQKKPAPQRQESADQARKSSGSNHPSPRTRRQTQLRALAQTSPRIREAGVRGLISQRPRQTALRICRS